MHAVTPHYDYIIAGGGCAGLSLAYHLNNSPLSDHSILIVDPDRKDQNDRTWSFWSDRSTPFDPIVAKEWSRISFYERDFCVSSQPNSLRYKTIRGIDFYRYVHQKLNRNPRISWLSGKISDIRDEPEGAIVTVNDRHIRGRWVFNSCYLPHRFEPPQSAYHHLWQHFLGWEIETTNAAFDDQTVRLMDFRTPQRSEARFMYLLPYSPKRALVEYTVFSDRMLEEEEYKAALHTYITNTLGISCYSIKYTEKSAIPMTDQPFPPALGRRIMNIGTVGGRTKCTTGYTFMRIQEDAENIVQSLTTTGQPFYKESPPRRRFAFYDSLLLNIISSKRYPAWKIFSKLFRRNPMSRILTFLDERSSIWQEALIFLQLPWKPFLQALIRVHQKQRASEKRLRTRLEPAIQLSQNNLKPRPSPSKQRLMEVV